MNDYKKNGLRMRSVLPMGGLMTSTMWVFTFQCWQKPRGSPDYPRLSRGGGSPGFSPGPTRPGVLKIVALFFGDCRDCNVAIMIPLNRSRAWCMPYIRWVTRVTLALIR